MLIVAPRGNTNELVWLRTPARCSILAIVNGNVPLLDAELNAVSNAGLIALANSHGFRRAKNFKINGNVIQACTTNAKNTANIYQASELKMALP